MEIFKIKADVKKDEVVAFKIGKNRIRGIILHEKGVLGFVKGLDFAFEED